MMIRIEGVSAQQYRHEAKRHARWPHRVFTCLRIKRAFIASVDLSLPLWAPRIYFHSFPFTK